MCTREEISWKFNGSLPALIVLAGGLSRRFDGKNKILLNIGGKSILERVITTFAPCVSAVYLSVRDNDQASLIQARESRLSGSVQFITDASAYTAGPIDGGNPRGLIRSPMTGLRACLTRISETHTFVASGDMPFIKRDVLHILVEYMNGDIEAAVPRWGNGYLEPTLALYNVQALDRAIERCWHQERYQLVQAVQMLDHVSFIPVDRIKEVDPCLDSFVNINDAADYEHAELRESSFDA